MVAGVATLTSCCPIQLRKAAAAPRPLRVRGARCALVTASPGLWTNYAVTSQVGTKLLLRAGSLPVQQMLTT